jgi:hypothetical protein
MSSTAFSLPSHHFDAQPEKPVELSEEEIRAALVKSREKNKLRYFPLSSIMLIGEYSDWGDEHCVGFCGRCCSVERGTEKEMVE